MRLAMCTFLALLSGCLTTPALSHLQPMAANASIDRGTSEVGVAASTDLAVSVAHAVPLASAKGVVFDLSGEAGLNHGAFTPGVWLRTGGAKRNQLHFGWRLGLASGLGDVGNYASWQRPWVGPSTNLQLSGASGDSAAWALTLGWEYTVPLVQDQSQFEVEMVPAFWLTLGTRGEFELSSGDVIFIGGGIAIDYIFPIPYGGVGMRF